MIQFNFESERMTTAQVVETSVTVNNNSPVQDYVHPDDHTQLTHNLFGRFGGVVHYSFDRSAGVWHKGDHLPLP